MRDYQDEVDELLSQAEELPDGSVKVAMFERAVEIADSHQDIELGFEVRLAMLFPLYYGNRSDLLLVHFAWLLASLDKNPDLPGYTLLWSYRWVLDTMPGFAEVPRVQIEASLQDMKKRYEAAGYSLRPWYVLQSRVYAGMEDRPRAEAAVKAFKKHRRDFMSDDEETELAFQVYHATFMKRYRAASHAAVKFLDRPRIDDHFRRGVIANMLIPWLRLGESALAAKLQPVSLRLLRKSQTRIATTGEHIEYLAVLGQFTPALRLLTAQFANALATPNAITRLCFLRAAHLLCDRLLAAGRTRLGLPAPPGPEFRNARNGRLTAAELRAWLAATLSDLAARLDARNGNTGYADQIAELAELNALAEKCAADGSARPSTRQRPS